MHHPRLRLIDYQPVIHQGQQMWLLQDPLQLSTHQLVVPQALAPILAYCDGSRSEREIHAALCVHLGESIPLQVVTEALQQLDQAFFLDNERSQVLQRQVLQQYRAQPHRPPALVDLSYPGDETALSQSLRAYGDGDNLDDWQPWQGRGIVSPHIDYPRGGPVYAKVWRRAKAAVAAADLILILGTDHNGGPGTITLTRQPYATPYGVLPTDVDLIDKVAQAIGEEDAFAEELHHRQEHSVELSAVWLHHIFQELGVPPCPMIPVLCGSFHHFVSNGATPDQDERLTAVIETWRQETAGRRVLVVASVDLAHVGPNFGDPFIMDPTRRQTLTVSDRQLMQAILLGDAADFYAQIAAVQDQHRICGFSSIYLMLRLLQNSSGTEVAYEHCAADPADHSLVSICGLLLD